MSVSDSFNMSDYPDLSASTPKHGMNKVHFKVLIPSVAAAAIVNEGKLKMGNLIEGNSTRVQISEENDFYPGTMERVCLMVGSVTSIREVHNYIMDRILECSRVQSGGNVQYNQLSCESSISASRMTFERHNQVKILVPNSTAGMIIGKSGSFIKEIKEKSGAFVQISQKSKDVSLAERCIVVAGQVDQMKTAVALILSKIAEDPQSGTCPNISYSDAQSPVASAYPTGSPYANASNIRSYSGSSDQSGLLKSYSNFCTSRYRSQSGFSVDSLCNTLKLLGYTPQATDDISKAMQVLDKYGFISMPMLCGASYSVPVAPMQLTPGDIAHQYSQLRSINPQQCSDGRNVTRMGAHANELTVANQVIQAKSVSEGQDPYSQAVGSSAALTGVPLAASSFPNGVCVVPAPMDMSSLGLLSGSLGQMRSLSGNSPVAYIDSRFASVSLSPCAVLPASGVQPMMPNTEIASLANYSAQAQSLEYFQEIEVPECLYKREIWTLLTEETQIKVVSHQKIKGTDDSYHFRLGLSIPQHCNIDQGIEFFNKQAALNCTPDVLTEDTNESSEGDNRQCEEGTLSSLSQPDLQIAN